MFWLKCKYDALYIYILTINLEKRTQALEMIATEFFVQGRITNKEIRRKIQVATEEYDDFWSGNGN